MAVADGPVGGGPVLDVMDAVVLAGGSARRMGGVDKTALVVGGSPLLDRVLAALTDATAVVVVGPRRPVRDGARVTWVREDPPGGGPVAALAAALPLVTAPLVALVAADLPFLSAATVGRLRAAVTPVTGAAVDGALLVDPGGRDQLLTGVWRTGALRAAIPAEPRGVALRTVLAGLRIARLPADARAKA
ncbi:MAG: molybdenum cofactor guanylyltransferase, partial [Frankia sp.]